MNNNFRNKKRDLTKKVDFSLENNNVEHITIEPQMPFQSVQPKHVSTDKTEKFYICINDIGEYMIGNAKEIENWINKDDYSENEIEIFELKSKNTVDFSIKTISTLKINS